MLVGDIFIILFSLRGKINWRDAFSLFILFLLRKSKNLQNKIETSKAHLHYFWRGFVSVSFFKIAEKRLYFSAIKISIIFVHFYKIFKNYFHSSIQFQFHFKILNQKQLCFLLTERKEVRCLDTQILRFYTIFGFYLKKLLSPLDDSHKNFNFLVKIWNKLVNTHLSGYWFCYVGCWFEWKNFGVHLSLVTR